MTSVDSESEVLSFHELEDIVRKNDDVAFKYAVYIGIALALIIYLTAYLIFLEVLDIGVDLDPTYRTEDSFIGIPIFSAIFTVLCFIPVEMFVHKRAAGIYGDRYTQAQANLREAGAIHEERTEADAIHEERKRKREEIWEAQKKAGRPTKKVFFGLWEREDYRRRKYSSYSSYPYSSSDDDDDDDSEDRRMCRKCHFRPVMGGRNYWAQSTCEQCLLEWDGDD